MSVHKGGNYIGNKYGRLYVYDQYNSGRGIMCKCICDCGKLVEKKGYRLTKGTTKSCGCLAQECMERGLRYKNGKSNTRLHQIWTNMHNRCKNPNIPSYKRYGARGIKVCNEWSGNQGFVNFYNWAMTNGYNEQLSIERIDNNGDYEPSNCTWITWREQSLNRNSSHFIEYNNQKKTLEEWVQEYGLNRTTFENRLKRGWSLEKALTYPIDEKRRNKNAVNISKGV